MAPDDRTNPARASADPDGALLHTHDIEHFEIPEGEPDPRGWDVRTADGQKLGKVSDMLVDTRTSRIRYLEVEVDHDLARQGGRDWALIPIGAARLNDDRDDVVVDLSTADIAGIPAYDRQRFSRDYERSLRTYVRGRRGATAATSATAATAATTASVADTEADFYAAPEYDDRTFFGARRGTLGGTLGGAVGGAPRGSLSGAEDRATTSGLGDRIADAADDLKDRVDANPASRPGPDATDRPIGPR